MRTKRWKWILALAVAASLLVGVGWPVFHNFVNFGLRARMGEARTNLKKLCQSQLIRLAEGAPATTYRKLAEVPEGNRYAYFVRSGPVLEQRPAADPLATGVQVDLLRFPAGSVERPVTEQDLPPQLAGSLRLGSNGTCPDCTWVLAAAGNLDADPQLDVWSVATRSRVGPSGQQLAACEPFHEQDEIQGAFEALFGAR